MFKYTCYIENTREAREWLEFIGWKENVWHKNDDILSAYKTLNILPTYISFKKGSEGIFLSNEDTDCRGNLPLFKALTAVRDDSDYMQYFTDGEDWYLCEADNFQGWAFMNKIPVYECTHKATKEELIERFKKKEL